MGSVIDYIECPNCGHEAYNDFYYKTGEEYVNCQNCGYHYSATYKTDDEGNYVTKDGTDNYEFDNLIMETKELKNPYGAYRLKYYDSVAYECGSLENEQNCVELLVEVKEMNNVEYFGINRFVNGEIVTMDVIDNGPKVDSAGFTAEDNELPF
jgi:DNA-directed RNA polymerase subunit RPC12/RpoP